LPASHYDRRRDATGWTIFDRWTDIVVVHQGTKQVGLSLMDAERMLAELNKRQRDGDRSILQ
jgi:hypothetical protein